MNAEHLEAAKRAYFSPSPHPERGMTQDEIVQRIGEEISAARIVGLEQAAKVANAVRLRANENGQAVRGRDLTLEHLKEVGWHIAGQRHAAAEIERDIRALLATEPRPRWQPINNETPKGWHNFFLARPTGNHTGDGQPYTPTVVQFVDGEFYSTDNELKPLYFGQNEPEDSPFRTVLEWCHLPE